MRLFCLTLSAQAQSHPCLRGGKAHTTQPYSPRSLLVQRQKFGGARATLLAAAGDPSLRTAAPTSQQVRHCLLLD
jgi:hypothetical protein